MNRRDRDRYDYDNYDRDYSEGAGYNRNDEHYHSARNLTNEFEQEYRSHHRDRDDDRFNRNSSNMRQSYHEGNRGDAYERRLEGRGTAGRNSGSEMHYGERNNNNWGENRNRSQNWSDADRYNTSGRYSQRSDDFDRGRDMRSQDRFSNQDRSSRMEQGRANRLNQEGRMREGYGISDYGRMRQSDIHSNRGVPNAGITSSLEDDYGVDFDRDRSSRISSGNYGGYSSQGGYNRNDRY
ncbi:hypothetical protein K3G39_13375 [Pontibacter sp. HSC-14F20]|uniref:hypothetical protein n=1 Tax=Pontibacter sp. HSC-14F20 TaxID=2864136 RepID=UPI001C72C0BD|nr:hypothetical protein [Pontibacter sp. HSC-14F20]MBX0334228.1 hypothetical protein [Pontibacter sp. HSC-14F20]